MAGEAVRWGRLHPRLQGILHIGATVPADRRAARNAYWFLFAQGRIEPAGWGDLSFADLERVAAHLDHDEAFVPIREHAGLHLTGPGRAGQDFDWSGTADDLPPLERFAEETAYVVLWNRVCLVGYTASSSSEAPEAGRAALCISPARLVEELGACR